ncbi:MAG: hypothetical protein V1729_03230 [Candidatus Woesearchaeota archaeon]
MLKKAGIGAAVAAAALVATLASGNAEASCERTKPEDVRQLAISVESKQAYKKAHPDDPKTGFSHSEDVHLHDLLSQFPCLDEESAYLLARNEPVLLQAYKNHTLDESLEQWVFGRNQSWFAPNQTFATVEQQAKHDALEAMRGKIDEGQLSQSLRKNGYFTISKEVLMSGIEAAYGAAPARSDSRSVQPQVDDSASVDNSDVEDSAAIPAPELDDSRDVTGVSDSRDLDVADVVVDTCSPATLNGKFAEIKSASKQRMDAGADESVVAGAANASYDSLTGQCPEQEGIIGASRAAHETNVAAYACGDVRFGKKLEDMTGRVKEMRDAGAEPSELRQYLDTRVAELQDECGDQPLLAGTLTEQKTALSTLIMDYECKGPRLQADLKGIKDAADASMVAEAAVDDIRSAADGAYAALEERCEVSAPKITKANTDLRKKIDEYMCGDVMVGKDIEGIRVGMQSSMDSHDDAEAIKTSTTEAYEALKVKCAQNVDEVGAALEALTPAIEAYIKAELNRAEMNLVDVGANAALPGIQKGKVGGHLRLRLANGAAAEDPFHLEAYLDGANDFRSVREIGPGSDLSRVGRVDQPYGGAIFELGTKSTTWRLSYGGQWKSKSTDYPASTTSEFVTRDVDGGTQTENSSTTTSESSRNNDDLLTGMLALESQLRLGDNNDWIIDLGVGFGRDAYNETVTSHTDNHTDVVDSSYTAGPPSVDVTTTTSADTSVDTKTVANAVTNMIAAHLGLVKKGENWTVGGDAVGAYRWSEISGRTTVDTQTTIGDTVSDINIEGMDPIQETTPGSASPSSDSDSFDRNPHGLTTGLRLRLNYDAEGVAIRLEPGWVGKWHNSQYELEQMHVGGNLTGLVQTQGVTLGANAAVYDDMADLHAYFSTDDDFKKVVSYVDAVNQMRIVSPMDSQLRERYIDNLFDNLVETTDGFIVDAGLQMPRKDDAHLEAAVGYVAQTSVGPLGASVKTDLSFVRPEDSAFGVTGYLPLPGDFSARVEGETHVEKPSQRRRWSAGASLVYHFDK